MTSRISDKAKSEVARIERTAYHEAGHAVATHLRKRRLNYVTIIRSGDALGHVKAWGRTSRKFYYSIGIGDELLQGSYRDWQYRRDLETALLIG